MGYLIGFAPWIVYWILVGNTGFIHAVAIALAIAIAGPIVQRIRGERLHSLDVGTVVVFVVLLALALLLSDAVLERWLQPASNAGLFLISLAGLAVGRPFVREYAESEVDAQTAASDGFRVITTAMTWMWVGTFGVMTVSSLIPPIVDGDATIRDQGHLLSVICYWVVPFTLVGIAGLISGVFPQWFDSRSRSVSARDATLPIREQPGPPKDVVDARISLSVPDTSRHDTPFPVRVEGCASGAEVRIQTNGTDLFGRKWRSAAVFTAPVAGPLDLASAAPVSGDWAVADGDAPIWAMRSAPAEGLSGMFVAPAGDWLVTVEATSGNAVVRRTVVRHAAPSSVTVSGEDIDGRAGLLALPSGPAPSGGWPAVVCFGGSEGGCDSQRQTIAMFASRGFAALAYNWLDEGAPVARIPLERFVSAVNWMSSRADVDSDRVSAIAISRGAEGLLAAAVSSPLIVRALVLVSPSAVSWQAVGPDGEIADTPSWTLYGEGFPYAQLPTGALMPQLVRNAWRVHRDIAASRPSLLKLCPAYQAGLTRPNEEAVLHAENVRCPVLCISGAADAVWPSASMAEMLLKRRSGVPHDRHIDFAGAGHLFRFGRFPTDALWAEGIAFGGERPAHAAAEREAAEHAVRFVTEVAVEARPFRPGQ
ncbi:acyl-CoA thioesterase/bile acid-CoA:amino acid N-acyltransferase family protein [Hoyosella subflava]|uniref:Possible acyl-CoA thioesterase n=1 Tax=Hoyosella subflava (strain DSM 45089 / JCM 17490 / NBRC 109087 / DQS3-9A1) TaxID=443218 RepID=F6EGQ6_HOYSD|nr:acyl-CoA thioesterase/bile acid-CoA:amino acid N-acyltransferase family protein [Hoyosella subflava]AEF42294.1 Possible acyl-CoA thioesterase [Hoyosella subflava DQS3-9A1]